MCRYPGAWTKEYINDLGKIDPYYMIMTYEGGEKVNNIYSGTHPKDHSVRPQAVTRKMNEIYYDTICEFERITSVPSILNTSFNLHGFPVVGKPSEAIDVLMESGLRYLAFEHCILVKS